MSFSRSTLLYLPMIILVVTLSCKSRSRAVTITEAEMIKMAEDTLRKIMTEEEFDQYRPLKVISGNDLYFEVVPHDIEEYDGFPPLCALIS